MNKIGVSGCFLMMLGLVGIVLLVFPMAAPSDLSAVQITQLNSGAVMWTTLLVAIGVGLLLLTVESVRVEIEKQLSPRAWEYCDLMEGRTRNVQAGEQRQVFRLLHYSQSGTEEQQVSSLPVALSELSQDGWELVSVHTIPYGAAIFETHWVFRRAVT